MVSFHEVGKNFGSHVILESISFSLKKGEVIGLLGENGSGKSTILNLAANTLTSNVGKITYDTEGNHLPMIGYLTDTPPLYPHMTVQEYFDFILAIRKGDRSHLDSLVTSLSLSGVENKLIKTLSKGYQQRVGIVSAFIGAPPLVLLDEPTNGLDPKQALEFRALIKKIKKQHTIFISSHVLSEVAQLCDTILFLEDKKIKRIIHPKDGETQVLEKLFKGGE